MKSDGFVPALGYSFLTPMYDLVVGVTTREAEFKRALVAQAKIEAGHRVLDLACGTGTLAILIKRTVPNSEITGIDGDSAMLETAKAKSKKAGTDIRFDNGMSFDLPYEDDSFDRVVSSLFFHHLTRDDKRRTLREVKRVLTPGGEFHVADWGRPANLIMRMASKAIQLLDGFETTADNFRGRLPQIIGEEGFGSVEETSSYDTLFGTIRLHKSRKI